MHQEDPFKCAHLSHPSSFLFLFCFLLFFHLVLLLLVVISNCLQLPMFVASVDLAPTCCYPDQEHHPYFQSDASFSRQLAQLAAEPVSLLLLRKAACPASGSVLLQPLQQRVHYACSFRASDVKVPGRNRVLLFRQISMTAYTCHCSITTCCSCTAPLAPRPALVF